MSHSHLPKLVSLYLLFAAAVTSVASWTPSSSGICTTAVLPITVTANNNNLSITAPKSQPELTDFFTRFTSQTSNTTAQFVQSGTVQNNATYEIWTQLCVPRTQDAAKTVELAIHGIGFDHSYWTFGGPGSQYNYVESAMAAGRSVLIFDRLGVGMSEKPNGISEVQTATHIEIAVQLINYLKGTPQGQQFNRFVGTGHSYGSLILLGVATKYGNILDATILTGFSTYQGGLPTALASFGSTIASTADNARFGSLPSSYFITNGPINDQQVFFSFPFYEQAVFQSAEDNKWTATLGEILTQSAAPALQYTNPVLLVTGDKDYLFCGGNCYQNVSGTGNIIETSRQVFPQITSYTTYIPANTGHALNLHFSAPQTYARITAWFAQM